MMWEYAWLEDETQISYSNVLGDNTITVVAERPRDWGFDCAKCLLPAMTWIENDGFSPTELDGLMVFVRNNAALITRFAYEGGRVYTCPV